MSNLYLERLPVVAKSKKQLREHSKARLQSALNIKQAQGQSKALYMQSVYEQSRWVCAQLLLSVCCVYQVPSWCSMLLNVPDDIIEDEQRLELFKQEQQRILELYLDQLNPKSKNTQEILDEALLLCSVHEQLIKGNVIFEYCFKNANGFNLSYLEHILEQHWVLGLRAWARQLVLRLRQKVCIKLIDQWSNKADGICVWLVRFVLMMKVHLGKKGTCARRWIGAIAKTQEQKPLCKQLILLVQALWAFLSEQQRWLCFLQHQCLISQSLTTEQCAPMWAQWEQWILRRSLCRGKGRNAHKSNTSGQSEAKSLGWAHAL